MKTFILIQRHMIRVHRVWFILLYTMFESIISLCIIYYYVFLTFFPVGLKYCIRRHLVASVVEMMSYEYTH